MLRIPFVGGAKEAGQDGYYIEEIKEETFLDGRAAGIYLQLDGKSRRIGEMGVLHPSVLEKFDLK